MRLFAIFQMLMNVKMAMDIVNSFVSTHLGPISVLVKLALDWKRIGKDVDGVSTMSQSFIKYKNFKWPMLFLCGMSYQ